MCLASTEISERVPLKVNRDFTAILLEAFEADDEAEVIALDGSGGGGGSAAAGVADAAAVASGSSGGGGDT